MFKIIALVSVMVSGSPVGEPMKFTHAEKFPSLETCQEFLDTEIKLDELTQDVQRALARRGLPEGATLSATASCQAKEDNTI